MNQVEILEELNELLDQHTKGIRGAMCQAGYKDDLFKPFVAAYFGNYFEASSSPRLTGDAISDYFYERWMQEKNDYNKKKGEYLRMLLIWWDEWHYAFQKYAKLCEDAIKYDEALKKHYAEYSDGKEKAS